MIKRYSLAVSALALLAVPAATAQSDDPVDSILVCRGIADAQQRLACFDQRSVALAEARNSGEIAVVTREDVEAFEGDSFGFNMPSLPRLSLPFMNRSTQPSTHDALAGVVAENEAAAAREAAEQAAAQAAAEAAQAPERPAAENTLAQIETPAAQPQQPAAPAQQPASPAAAPAAPAAAAPAPAAEETEPAPQSVEILERRDDGRVNVVRMQIERIEEVRRNNYRFHMENGQVWRQVDSRAVTLPRNRDNMTAEIQRAAVSSYLLRINGRSRAIRVTRER